MKLWPAVYAKNKLSPTESEGGRAFKHKDTELAVVNSLEPTEGSKECGQVPESTCYEVNP